MIGISSVSTKRFIGFQLVEVHNQQGGFAKRVANSLFNWAGVDAVQARMTMEVLCQIDIDEQTLVVTVFWLYLKVKVHRAFLPEVV